MVPEKTCSFPDCQRTHKAKGLCDTHYNQYRRGAALRPVAGPITHQICVIDGCGKVRDARGWCATHYGRWRKTGDPMSVGLIMGNDVERFWSHVNKTDTCWGWTSRTISAGYGDFTVQGAHKLAHRFAYEIEHGPIAEGMMIDHRCHNRTCVNPTHLRMVTPKQNMENRAGLARNNKSGVRGVHFYPSRGSWRATVGHNGRMVHVGYFASVAEAEGAVIAKRLELHTHNDLDRAKV